METQADSSGGCWWVEGSSKKGNRFVDTNISVVIAGGRSLRGGERWYKEGKW